MGDGGAVMTDDTLLAGKIRMIASHGQSKKYYHEVVGCNSRLDTIQAAILNVKLPHLSEYLQARKAAAEFYMDSLKDFKYGILPASFSSSPPTWNQYTLKIKDGLRDEFKDYLAQNGIPSIIYYPLPLYKQAAFNKFAPAGFSLPVSEKLSKSVLSLPIHTEMTTSELEYISGTILNFKK